MVCNVGFAVGVVLGGAVLVSDGELVFCGVESDGVDHLEHPVSECEAVAVTCCSPRSNTQRHSFVRVVGE